MQTPRVCSEVVITAAPAAALGGLKRIIGAGDLLPKNKNRLPARPVEVIDRADLALE